MLKRKQIGYALKIPKPTEVLNTLFGKTDGKRFFVVDGPLPLTKCAEHTYECLVYILLTSLARCSHTLPIPRSLGHLCKLITRPSTILPSVVPT